MLDFRLWANKTFLIKWKGKVYYWMIIPAELSNDSQDSESTAPKIATGVKMQNVFKMG